jgi:AcrR family transcriptional regulator
VTTPTGQAISEPVRRGRPRSEKARQAILTAAADLLIARGLGAVSMDTVAERAGVSKATIYRWWPSKETLALDALFEQWDSVRTAAADTGPLRADLLSLIRPWVRLVSQPPYARVIAALINAAATDPEFAQLYRERVVQPRREQADVIFANAIERGEISAEVNIDVAIDMLYGPLYHRLLHGHAPLSDAVGDQVIDMLLAGLRPRTTSATT